MSDVDNKHRVVPHRSVIGAQQQAVFFLLARQSVDLTVSVRLRVLAGEPFLYIQLNSLSSKRESPKIQELDSRS